MENIKLVINFELNYKGTSIPVSLNSHPVYLRTVDDVTMAAGMLFIENELSEIKKVSDFLFFQFETSFTDSLYHPRKKHEFDNTKGKGGPQTDNNIIPGADIPAEHGFPEPQHTNAVFAGSDMDYLKTEMARLTALMKVIQETTRHIDERIYILESKLDRKL